MTINISSNTIFRTIMILLVFGFLFYISDILLLLFIAFVIVSAITPLVDRMEKVKIPRVAGALMIFLTFFVGFGYLISLAVPPLITQAEQLFSNLPTFLTSLANNPWVHYIFNPGDTDNSEGILKILGSSFTSMGIFSQAGSFLSRLLYFAVLFSLSFYMVIQKNALSKTIRYVLPEEHEEYVVSLVERIQEKMGRWLQGQLILDLIVGTAVYVVLYFLGIPYAFILAIVAGILEFIPTIGPTISAFIAIAVALTISPVTALFVLIAFVIIQQLENHVIVPLVMKKAVGLNPVIVIVVLLIGAKLGGPIGAVMAVPITTALSVFISDLLEKEDQAHLA